MRYSPEQCEKEGCAAVPTFIIVDRKRGWMWVACPDHEAEKSPEEASVPLPEPVPE
jgi:hypothetical protein